MDKMVYSLIFGSGGRFGLFDELLLIYQASRRCPGLAEICQLGILGLQDQPIAEIDAIISPDEAGMFFHDVQHTQPHTGY